MARKIVLFGTILGLVFVIANYHFLEQKQPEKAKKEITIFTLDTLTGIHAKMILGERGVVTIAKSKKLSETEKTALKNSDIFIDSVALSDSPLSQELQNYHGTYVSIPELSMNEVLHKNEALSEQITGIRDAVVSNDKTRPGYYYDNAGNYTHLIDTLYESIQNRLSKYHKTKFITIGGDFDYFTEKFGLTEYQAKKYNSLRDFINDASLKDFIKNGNVNHVFVFFGMTDYEVKNIEKTYHVTIYRLPSVEEDTSAWGYLRYLEKVADQFVRAFDTYD